MPASLSNALAFIQKFTTDEGFFSTGCLSLTVSYALDSSLYQPYTVPFTVVQSPGSFEAADIFIGFSENPNQWGMNAVEEKKVISQCFSTINPSFIVD